MIEEERQLKHQARLEEFRALREEMMYALRSRVWGLVSYAVISGGILGFWPKSTSFGAPCIVILSLALPYIWYTTYLERMRTRISAYIFIIIEPAVPGLHWHDFLSDWRSKIHKGNTKLKRTLDGWRYVLSITGVYDVVSLVCFYFILGSALSAWLKVLSVIILVLLIEGHIHLRKVLSASEEYRDIFQAHLAESDQPREQK